MISMSDPTYFLNCPSNIYKKWAIKIVKQKYSNVVFNGNPIAFLF